MDDLPTLLSPRSTTLKIESELVERLSIIEFPFYEINRAPLKLRSMELCMTLKICFSSVISSVSCLEEMEELSLVVVPAPVWNRSLAEWFDVAMLSQI